MLPRPGVLGAAVLVSAMVACAGSIGALRTADSFTPRLAAATVQSTTSMDGVEGEPNGKSSVNAFGTWRGKPVTLAIDYLGGSTWSSIANTTWAPGRYTNSGMHVVWSMAMLPSDGSGTLESEASGVDNQYFVSAAQTLVSNGQGSSTIRLGWEDNGTWFPWSGVNDPSAYAAAWRQVVTAIRSVPGSNFTFEWNTANGNADPTAMYPGDAYVDYVGDDVYDQSFAVSYPATDHSAVWNELTTKPFGMNWVAAFAAQHGKPIAISEWGESFRCDGHGGGDDPSFVQNMHDWFASHNIGYEAVFNSDDDSCHVFTLTGGDFPKAAELYKTLFGSSTPSASPSATAAAPTPTPSASPMQTAAGTPTTTGPPSPSASDVPSPAVTVSPSASDVPSPAVTVSPIASPVLSSASSAATLVGPSVTPVVSPAIAGIDSAPAPVPPSNSGSRPPDLVLFENAGLQAVPLRAPATHPLSAGTLMFSANADRSHPGHADGAHVRGRIYLFLRTPTGAASVRFALDTRRSHLDTSVPFDAVGGSKKHATALDTTHLSAGRHVMHVTVAFPGQSSRTADFVLLVIR